MGGPEDAKSKEKGKSESDTRMRMHNPPERRISYITIASLLFQSRRSTASGCLAHIQHIILPWE